MGRRRTRARQLAKLAQRRAAERRRRQRQRLIAAVVALAVAVGGGVFLFMAFIGNDDEPRPRASRTPTTPTPTETGPPPAPDCGEEFPEETPDPQASPPYTEPPPLEIDEEKEYIATITTSCGVMKFELLPKEAPQTVNSFVFLAREDYFDRTYFHRIADSIDVIQGGDPTGTGSGGPGYTLPDEWKNSDLKFDIGTLAMAHSSAPNSGGSQFFVITGPKGVSGIPQEYTVFGRILDGLKVAKTIQRIPVLGADAPSPDQQERPTLAVYIENVYVKAKDPEDAES